MDYTTLIAESKEGQEQPPKGMQSLYEVCHQVVDGREARGKQYDLAGLLVVLVLAKLAGSLPSCAPCGTDRASSLAGSPAHLDCRWRYPTERGPRWH